jgi:hypothetical protein
MLGFTLEILHYAGDGRVPMAAVECKLSADRHPRILDPELVHHRFIYHHIVLGVLLCPGHAAVSFPRQEP